jgi:acid phosphatase type 7
VKSPATQLLNSKLLTPAEKNTHLLKEAEMHNRIKRRAKKTLPNPDHFAIRPYLRLGGSPEQSLELIWFSSLKQKHWCVQFKAQEHDRWITLRPDKVVHLKIANEKVNRFVTQLPRLSDEQILYRVLVDQQAVFEGQFTSKDRWAKSSRVVAFGDYGDGETSSQRTAEAVIRVKPDLLVLLGDLVYDYGRVLEYLLNFFPVLGALLAGVVTVPVSGNHDIGSPQQNELAREQVFEDLFGFYEFWKNPDNGPRLSKESRKRLLKRRKGRSLFNRFGKHFAALTNYSFDWANSHWVVLDANKFMDWTLSELREWLEDDLRQSNAEFKIVCWHQPALCSDKSYRTDRRMLAIQDILQRNNVVLALSGHSHVFECSYPVRLEEGQLKRVDPQLFDGKVNTQLPDGYVIHLVSGAPSKLPTVGAEPEHVQPTTRVLIYDQNSFTQLDFTPGRLEVSQIGSINGNVLDSFVITRARTS